MRKFDYSFLKMESLPMELLNITNSISELKALAGVRKDDNKEVFVKLESVAKVQSVKGSNAIEGIITTDKRIEEIVNNSSAPLNHNEMEIAGYRDALNLIHENYAMLSLSENLILRLHDMLLSYTGYQGRGLYKVDDNVIMEMDEFGNRKVRFSPTPAYETQAAMEQLIFAYQDAVSDSAINHLLLIPCFILDFLCIHPFADGNGRMSRLLSLLLLYKNGIEVGKYISYEEQINKHKGWYYESLKESSDNWESNGNSYLPFIKNFLTMLYSCYKELDKRFAIVHGKKVSKKSRIEDAVMNSLIPISKKEIADILPDVSPSTIEAVLSKMMKDDIVEKIGSYKNAKYIRK
ncbi:MAG: Fic family protein [Bacillota bacterium]